MLEETMHSLFKGREAWFALGFMPVNAPLTPDIIIAHVEQETDNAIGIYPITEDDRVWLTALDVDNHEGQNARWRAQVEKVFRLLRDRDLTPLVEISSSGEGAHLWFFFDRKTRPKLARDFWKAVRSLVDKDTARWMREFYPRQDSRLTTEKKFGNLIRLPLWKRSRFVDVEGGWSTVEPTVALERVVRIDPSLLIPVVQEAPEVRSKPKTSATPKASFETLGVAPGLSDRVARRNSSTATPAWRSPGPSPRPSSWPSSPSPR